MKRALYLVRKAPGPLADETTDMMLVSGVFEQPTSVLFVDDGVYQLVGLDRRQSSLKALPTYDITALYACQQSLAARGLPDLVSDAMDVEIVEPSAVSALISAHDVVIPD